MNLPLSGDDAVLPPAGLPIEKVALVLAASSWLGLAPRGQGVTRAYARRLRNLHDGCGVLVPVSRTERPQSRERLKLTRCCH